ncbi:MAG: hypothetical protein HY074_07940 [Deltaproteobacteria bacterium]|nr:hypothetical protein [Deltaproteobacteria bacterium]
MATLLMSDRLKYTDSVFRAGTAPDRDSAAMVIAKTVSTEAPANLLSWVWTLDPIRQRHVMSAMPFTDRHVIVAYLNEMSRPEHDDDKRRAVLTGMFQSRAHFQVISWIGVQSRDVAVKTMRLYRDAGGDLAELGNWLAGAGALLKAGGAVGAATDGFLSNLANSVGGALHSAATTVADGLGAAAGEVVDLFSTLKEAVSTVLDAMGKSAADFAAAMGSALSKGADYVEGVVNAVLNAGKKVGQLLSAVATLADTAVTALLDYLVNKLSNGFKLVIAWIADQASAVAKRFYGFVKALGKRVREMLGAIYEKGGQLIRKFVATIVAFGEDFVSILKEAAAAARRVFYAVEKWLATQAAPFIEKIIRMLHELGEIAVLAILCIVNAGRYLIPLYLVAKEIPMAYPGWTSKTDITQVPGLNVLRVSSTLKYVIFSDLHRGGSVDNALHVERAHHGRQSAGLARNTLAA